MGLKSSPVRYVFIGSPDDYEFDEILAVSRMLPNKIYYTNKTKLLLTQIKKGKEVLKPLRLVRIDLKTSSATYYEGPKFHSSELRKYILTSGLPIPVHYKSKLFAQMTAEGIPILAIFEHDYKSKKIIDMIKPVRIQLTCRLKTRSKVH